MNVFFFPPVVLKSGKRSKIIYAADNVLVLFRVGWPSLGNEIQIFESGFGTLLSVLIL